MKNPGKQIDHVLNAFIVAAFRQRQRSRRRCRRQIMKAATTNEANANAQGAAQVRARKVASE